MTKPSGTVAGMIAAHRANERAKHADTCEAEADHPHDCATATELGRLRAFAEAVREEFECVDDNNDALPENHVDDCLHCYAVQALERAR
jgi:hypothetical protein